MDFETVMTRLQMGTWLVVADFEYRYDKKGEPYGWGIARYTTPEVLFGKEKVQAAGNRSPEESKQRLIDYLTQLLPQATPEQILNILKVKVALRSAQLCHYECTFVPQALHNCAKRMAQLPILV